MCSSDLIESRIIHITGDYAYWTLPTITGGNYSREAVVQNMKERSGSYYDPELIEKFLEFLPGFNARVEV